MDQVITQVKQEAGAGGDGDHQPEVVATADTNGNNDDLSVAQQQGLRPPPRKNKLLYSLFCCFGQFRRGKGKSKADGTGLQEASGFNSQQLLPLLEERDKTKKCMVIDLDETLVHSSFKPISNADFIVPVEIDGTIHQVYVLKRPHVDEFLRAMGEMYECILFTASLAKYADPVCDLLDKWEIFRSRLFREHCVFHRGNYVKDLARLGRELGKIIIIDNSPASYIFHPDNAVPVVSWFDDMNDQELLDLIPFLESLSKVDNIYNVLRTVQKNLGGGLNLKPTNIPIPPMPAAAPPGLPP